MIPPTSGTNHLITYLRTMIPSTAIDRIITDYRIASTQDQAIIFLQLATPEACAAHIDLADWLIQYLEDKNA